MTQSIARYNFETIYRTIRTKGDFLTYSKRQQLQLIPFVNG